MNDILYQQDENTTCTWQISIATEFLRKFPPHEFPRSHDVLPQVILSPSIFFNFAHFMLASVAFVLHLELPTMI